jgi:hypothetical protein
LLTAGLKTWLDTIKCALVLDLGSSFAGKVCRSLGKANAKDSPQSRCKLMSLNAVNCLYTRRLSDPSRVAFTICDKTLANRLRNKATHAPGPPGYRSFLSSVRSNVTKPGRQFILCKSRRPVMPHPAKPGLEKQYMSTQPPPKKLAVEPRPSSR